MIPNMLSTHWGEDESAQADVEGSHLTFHIDSGTTSIPIASLAAPVSSTTPMHIHLTFNLDMQGGAITPAIQTEPRPESRELELKARLRANPRRLPKLRPEDNHSGTVPIGQLDRVTSAPNGKMATPPYTPHSSKPNSSTGELLRTSATASPTHRITTGEISRADFGEEVESLYDDDEQMDGQDWNAVNDRTYENDLPDVEYAQLRAGEEQAPISTEDQELFRADNGRGDDRTRSRKRSLSSIGSSRGRSLELKAIHGAPPAEGFSPGHRNRTPTQSPYRRDSRSRRSASSRQSSRQRQSHPASGSTSPRRQTRATMNHPQETSRTVVHARHDDSTDSQGHPNPSDAHRPGQAVESTEPQSQKSLHSRLFPKPKKLFLRCPLNHPAEQRHHPATPHPTYNEEEYRRLVLHAEKYGDLPSDLRRPGISLHSQNTDLQMRDVSPARGRSDLEVPRFGNHSSTMVQQPQRLDRYASQAPREPRIMVAQNSARIQYNEYHEDDRTRYQNHEPPMKRQKVTQDLSKRGRFEQYVGNDGNDSGFGQRGPAWQAPQNRVPFREHSQSQPAYISQQNIRQDTRRPVDSNMFNQPRREYNPQQINGGTMEPRNFQNGRKRRLSDY